ncbi:MAG: hypothetical protein HQK79_12395 [Desulfobacterales bacterium]|nr:hypothetical protein [Desulfobacterales bacterium]MBF0396797.1 hypothetical protein [Desulfobacterales bacterium]
MNIIENLWLNRILPVIRETFFDERIYSLPFSKQFFESFKNFFKLSKFEFVRNLMPEFDPDKTNISWIPINKKIEGKKEIALPEEILGKLIEKAKHRVIVNFCGCRSASSCKNYSSDIGCLMMGESALLIPGKSSREVGVEEAKAHVRKAIDLGLVPITGKARIDNDIFMIPDEGKLLTVCFCCECCCITRFTRYLPPDLMDKLHHPVEGLSIEVTDACVGCGKCVNKCYLRAIEIQNDKAVIGTMCRVCGRCAMICPTKAIKLKLNNDRAVEDVVNRIESVVNFN